MTDLPTGFADAARIAHDAVCETFTATRDPQTAPGSWVLLTVYQAVVTDRQQRRRLRSAMLAAERLNGLPGLLSALEAGFTSENRPYLATAVSTITNLRAMLARHGPLPVAEVARVGADLAGALDAAHHEGVLHLDVCPENIWLEETGAVALRGFGVLRALRAVAGMSVPPVMLVHAPRELFGWHTPSPATDVYQLGSTLYELLAGQPAFGPHARLGQAALYQRVLRGEPAHIARNDLPGRFDALVDRMMATDPAERPTLAEIQDALRVLARATAGPPFMVPLAQRVPMPAQEPVQQQEPVSMPEPLPELEPLRAPDPELLPDPGPEPLPELVSGPEPEPTPFLELLFEPEPLSEPATLLVPVFEPEAIPEPVPEPPTVPVSEPEPVPQPAISIAVTQWPPKEGQVPAVQGERQQSTVLTLAPPEEEREPIPETRQHAGDRRRRAEPAHRYVGLGLLVAAGLVALVAGLVWGSVTGGNSARTSAPRPTAAPSTQPPSTQPATAQPSLLPQPLLDQYRATGLVVAPGSGSTLISWQAPQRTDHVALFVIIAELNSRPVTQQEVGVGGRSVAFTGLLPRQDYCFVVATIVEQDSGAAAMAVTQPVCAVSRTGNG